MKPIVFAIALFAVALTARWGGPRAVGPYDEAYHWKRIAWIAGGGPQTADRRPQFGPRTADRLQFGSQTADRRPQLPSRKSASLAVTPLPAGEGGATDPERSEGEGAPGEGRESRTTPLRTQDSGLRTSRAAIHGLTALDFDLDRGIHGAFCPWPPLYDAAMGAIARAIGLERIIWIPPIAFALFVAILVALWSGCGETRLATSQPRDLVTASRRSLLTATTAAAAIALSPYLIGISRVSAIDHHWTEPLLVVAIVGGVVRKSAIGLAMAMTAALFVQTALIVACGVALVAILFVQREPRALRAGAAAFAFAAVAVTIYRAMRPEGYPSGPWFLGWTHATLLAAGAVACSVPAMSRRMPAEDHAKASSRSRWLGVAAGGVVVAPLAGSILAGTRFFSGDPWLQSIIEFQPMFLDTSRIGTDLANLGGGVLALAIVAAVEWLDRHARAKDSLGRPALLDSPNVAVIALFAAIYLVLAISSRRFLVPGIALFAIAGGIASTSRRRWAAIAALVLTIAPPLAYDVYAMASREAATVDPLMTVTAEIAPLPAGRVLAPWHAGHAIDVFGRHAVVIDNFGSMPDPKLFAEANATLVERDPGALLAWCRSREVRYLVLLDPDLHLPAAAACLGIDPRLYARTPLARQTVWSRLWRGEPIGGFRRVAPHVWQME